MKKLYLLVSIVILLNLALVTYIYFEKQSKNISIPNLVGTWEGENVTVSDLKGYKVWGEKIIHITEQKDRRFRGTFTYPDGTKTFLA